MIVTFFYCYHLNLIYDSLTGLTSFGKYDIVGQNLSFGNDI